MTLLKRKPAWRSVVVMSFSSGEGEHDGFLAFIAQPGLAGEGTTAERGPLGDLLLVVGTVTQRQQRAIECVTVEIEQADFVDQATGFDQPSCACLAPGVLEFGLLLSEPGFLLFMRAQTLGQRTGHGIPLS